MTNEELCLRYQAGDTDAAEELVSRNKGFIHKIAEQYPCDFRNPVWISTIICRRARLRCFEPHPSLIRLDRFCF